MNYSGIDEKVQNQLNAQIDLCKRLCQLSDMLIYRLNKYEETERFENNLAEIVKEIGSLTSEKVKIDPTALI